jgi:hypothetical protein
MSARAWLTAVSILVAAPCLAQETPTATAQNPAAQVPPIQQQVTSTPPDFPRGRISGLAFGDIYYNVAGDPNHHYNAAGSDSDKTNIDNSIAQQIGKDLNGFQIRRLYFQLDNDLSIKYSTRFRLEADSKSLTSDGKLGVNVKALYLQARDLYTRADGFIGMVSTPTWENPEEFWGYRSIEKTIADFRGIGTAADIGGELKGFVDPDHKLGYSFMVSNGIGQKPEDNRYKKVMLAVPIRVGDLHLEPYGDYEGGANATDRATYKLFAGYELKRNAVGLEVVDRVNHRPVGGNQEPFGISVYARGNPAATLSGYVRFDLWKPDKRADNRVDQQLWIAGLDWQPFKDVHVMPNFEGTQFDAKGTAVAPPHHETQARITFYYKYAKPNS